MPVPHGGSGLARGHKWCILGEPMGCNRGHLSHPLMVVPLLFGTAAHTHADMKGNMGRVHWYLAISVWKQAPNFEVKQVAEEETETLNTQKEFTAIYCYIKYRQLLTELYVRVLLTSAAQKMDFPCLFRLNGSKCLLGLTGVSRPAPLPPLFLPSPPHFFPSSPFCPCIPPARPPRRICCWRQS